MKKFFKIADLDCAHCAVKLEDALRKIEGVENVSVNFLSQKLTLQAPDDRFDDVLRQALQVCRKAGCSVML